MLNSYHPLGGDIEHSLSASTMDVSVQHTRHEIRRKIEGEKTDIKNYYLVMRKSSSALSFTGVELGGLGERVGGRREGSEEGERGRVV